MTTTITPFTIPDCKIEGRRWVFIASPSRWKQKGSRVIVCSPRTEISKGAGDVVLVKRCSPDESVCFMGRDDIEKNNSKIYDKLGVSRARLSIDAHGVAIIDGSCDDFRYAKGDKFWMYVGSDTGKYKETSTVPVVNLQTYKVGVVHAKHVCWYPKIQGPDEECWTPGGTFRKLKLVGSNNFISWSFVVRQKLDGTPPSVDEVPLPVKESGLQLDAANQDTLFRRLYEVQTAELSKDDAKKIPRQLEELRSPASSDALNEIPDEPEEMRISISSDVLHKPSTALLTPPIFDDWTYSQELSPTDAKERFRVKSRGRAVKTNFLNPDPPLAQSMLRKSSSNTSYHQRRPARRLSADKGHESFDIAASIMASASPTNLRPLEAKDGLPISDQTSKDTSFAKTLEGLGTNNSCDSATRPPFPGNDLDSIANYYKKYGKDPKSRFGDSGRNNTSKVCDLKNENCEYSILQRGKHFHVSGARCLGGPTHDHCVSRLRPEPATKGDCLLRLRKATKHHLCCWEGPSAEHSEPLKYDDRKQREAEEKEIRIFDLSGSRTSYNSRFGHSRVVKEAPRIEGELSNTIGPEDLTFLSPYLASMGSSYSFDEKVSKITQNMVRTQDLDIAVNPESEEAESDLEKSIDEVLIGEMICYGPYIKNMMGIPGPI